MLAHKFYCITDYFDFDKFIDFAGVFKKTCGAFFTQLNIQGRMIVDFQHPRLELAIDEDVEAENLEAVAFPLIPPPVELVFLVYE